MARDRMPSSENVKADVQSVGFCTAEATTDECSGGHSNREGSVMSKNCYNMLGCAQLPVVEKMVNPMGPLGQGHPLCSASRFGEMQRSSQDAQFPMTARDIALSIWGWDAVHSLHNERDDVDKGSVWVMGMKMGEAAPGKETKTWKRVLWVLLFPLILLWHSIRIYFLPCLQVYADRFFGALCLNIGKTFCCMCTCKCWRQQEKCFLCEYDDPEFPATGKSLGKWKGKSEVELNQITWTRAAELKKGEKAALFQGGISPGDIAQGQLGDCWLMAALACLAEHPSAIQRCFISKERNVRGCYVIELYHAPQKTFKRITIDDYLPTDNGVPLFAKPNGSELWVLLLEKAFAKMFGDYHSLAGGHVGVAFEAMTGDNVLRFELEDGKWRKYSLVHTTTEGKLKVGLRKAVPEEAYDNAEFFDILAMYDKLRSVMGAGSTQGRSDTKADSKAGICQGHAYSVIKCVKSGGFRMLQLRNPWGDFEWTGSWADQSPLWQQHSDVARACGYNAQGGGAKDDGVFWMEMGDFAKYFDMIDICHRHTGLSDLRLSTYEDEGCFGPTKGCLLGCGAYYCCCQGPYALCFPQESTNETQKPSRCFPCCPV